MATIESILAGSDLRSEAVIGEAVRLAEALGARLLLVHALDRQTVDDLRKELPEEQGFVDVLVARRREELRRLAGGGAAEPPWFVETQVVLGEPQEVLLRAVREHRPDLVVIGRRQRSRVGKFILGSVTQEILLSVTEPVLTVAT